MTKKIKVPESIEAAENRLVALDGIATATGWERAAIVWAFTKEGTAGRPAKGNVLTSEQISVAAFAKLGIKGLASRNTIDFYRDNWKQAIEDGHVQDVKPGDSVTLPDIDWPVQERNTGSRPTPTNIGKQMANDPALLQAAIEAAGDLAPEAVAEQVAKPAVAEQVMQQAPARKAIIKGAAKARSATTAQSRMPTPKKTDPADVVERDLNQLELQGFITEIHVYGNDAESAARKAHDTLQRIKSYLTPEQADDLAEVVRSARDAWDMVGDYITSGPVTDEDIHALIDSQGGDA